MATACASCAAPSCAATATSSASTCDRSPPTDRASHGETREPALLALGQPRAADVALLRQSACAYAEPRRARRPRGEVRQCLHREPDLLSRPRLDRDRALPAHDRLL